jgi:hypothetical protein
MCNCGNKRDTITQSQSNGQAVVETSTVRVWPDVNFEYTGNSGLSVTGGVTGKKYRFNNPGDIQLIDYRDASGMMAIPVLKKTKGKE